MEYTHLGRSGLMVSKLCLGTMAFGNSCDEKESHRIMDAALDAGINFFDTADNYGKATHNEGITETIIGRWFKQGGGRRERVVLTTKVHEEMHNPYDGPNSPSGLSAYKVRRHLRDSMARLQTDHIELYFMHHIDRSTSWEEMWDVFEQLYRDGLIDYVGTSNHPAWYFTMGQEKANQRHFFGIAAEQHLYNLLTRQAELEVLPAAKKQGIAIMTWSPLAGGRLTAAGFESMKARNEAGQLTPAQQKTLEQLKQFDTFCKDLGVAQEVAGLAWQVRNPYVTCPLIGVNCAEQIESSVKALEVKLTPEAMRQLDEIFPRMGEAPEAYAW
ncbi:MAG: aldo/keto reductase [Clostridiales bacterium]|nr:aldo/keto reductase [Clostridiales bacterium]